MKANLPIAAVCWGFAAIAAGGGIELVLPESPSAVERSAAGELKKAIKRMTGREAAVVSERAAGQDSLRFYVGDTHEAAHIFPDAKWKPDEIAVKSVPSGLVLTGDSVRGALYAVDTYLEDVCGVRWWTAESSFYPKLSDLPVKDVSIRHAPPFRYRETFYLGALDPRFKVRLKGNFTSRAKYQLRQPERIPTELGGDSTLHFFEKRSSSYHSMLQILPPEKYFAAHPEWYSLVGGKRKPSQLCLSDENMKKVFIGELDALLSDNPDTNFIQVSQDDRSERCECAVCQKVEEEEGAVSGLYLRFVNDVAAALEPKFPNVTFDTFAYRFTRTPPRKTQPRRNVTVRLCDIECAFNAPLAGFAATNSAFLADLEGWSRIARGRLYVWDYVPNFSACMVPHPNLASIAPNIRLFAESGAVGVFEQGDSVCAAGELAPFRAWYIAHLLWNPAADERRLREEFAKGYYGPLAAPHMLKYMEALERAGVDAAAKGVAVHCYHTNVDGFWTREQALAAFAELDAAFEEARGNGDEFARRVDRERLAARLVKLLNWKAWRLGSENERMELFHDWYRGCLANGVKAYREAWGAADFETCAAAVRRGIVPTSIDGIVPKPKAPGKIGFVRAKPFPTRNLQPHSSFELGLKPHGAYVTLPFSANPVQPEVAVDETAAVHGRRSIRIDNRRTGGEVQLVMAETEVLPERGPFTVSAYVKADRPAKVLFGAARSQVDEVGTDAIYKRVVVDVGTEWQRIKIGGIRVKEPVSGFAVQLGVASDAVVWVDAVQVEVSSGALAEYAPCAPIEAAFDASSRLLTRVDDSPVSCSATLRACTYYDEPQDVVFDTDAGKMELRIEPGKPAARAVRMTYERNGNATLGGTFATATHGVTGVVAPDEVAVVADVPLKAAPGFRIGACGITGLAAVKRPEKGWSRFQDGEKVWRAPLGYSLDEYYRDLRRGGYSIARFHDGSFTWQDVEPVKGQFDWSKLDVMEPAMRRNGIDIMFLFASRAVFCTRPKGDTEADRAWFVRRNAREGEHRGKTKGARRDDRIYYHPLDSDWTDWIRAVVTRYHDRIRLWEIVNEPDGTMESAPVYSHYAELCYKTVKSIAPDSTVIGVCSTGDLGLDEANFFRRAGEAGAFQWLDAASFHPYAQPLDYEGKDGELAIANLRSISDGFRKGVPFWETELYYMRGRTKAQVDQWKQYKKAGDPRGRKLSNAESMIFPAGNLVKRYAIDLGCGCAGSTPLSHDQHRSMGPGRTTSLMGGGLIGIAPSFAVCGNYFASAAFAKYLEGAKPLRKPKLGAGYNGYAYRDRNGGQVAVIWRRPGADAANVHLPAGSIARDIFGNRLEGSEILVSGEPVYVFASGGLQP